MTNLKTEIFKLACDTSDGTVSAVDAAHQFLALLDAHVIEARIDELERLLGTREYKSSNRQIAMHVVKDRLLDLKRGAI